MLIIHFYDIFMKKISLKIHLQMSEEKWTNKMGKRRQPESFKCAYTITGSEHFAAEL